MVLRKLTLSLLTTMYTPLAPLPCHCSFLSLFCSLYLYALSPLTFFKWKDRRNQGRRLIASLLPRANLLPTSSRKGRKQRKLTHLPSYSQAAPPTGRPPAKSTLNNKRMVEVWKGPSYGMTQYEEGKKYGLYQ